MAIRHQLEFWMTIAFGLYIIAFFVARRFWRAHVLLALAGFLADMYATYLMVQVRSSSGQLFFELSVFIQLHTALSVIAIALFFFQAFLGYFALSSDERKRVKYRRLHILSAKRVFLPIWAFAYGSGFFMVFV